MAFLSRAWLGRRRQSRNLGRSSSAFSAAKKRWHNLHGRSLRLEPLEDRSLLSVFLVNNISDGPVAHPGDLPGSLRQAIYDANNNPGTDTIAFDASLGGQTITLTQGELDLTDTTGSTRFCRKTANDTLSEGIGG